MTGRAQLAGGGGDLGRCFEVFKASAFRLETLRAYAVRPRVSACGPSGWDFPGPSARCGQVRGCA